MALVDTDVLIDVLRGHAPALNWLASLPDPPDVPGLVAMELYQGCHNKREADAVTRLLRRFVIVWPSPLDANIALLHYAALKLSLGIGLLDCLIAACAVERSRYALHVQPQALSRLSRPEHCRALQEALSRPQTASDVVSYRHRNYHPL